MAADSAQIDTRIAVITPENIAFEYRVAGPFRRLPAYAIDVLIRFVVLAIAFVLLLLFFAVVEMQGIYSELGDLLQGLGIGALLVLFFVIDWFYGGLFEVFLNGQTPGKRMMGIRVVTVEGQPINAVQAILRNILRAVDALPAAIPTMYPGWLMSSFQVGLFSAACNSRFQRLGDMAAGTMVVVEDRNPHWGVPRVTAPEAIRLAAQIPGSFDVSRTLARTLAAYMGRRANLPPRRRAEIAAHLGEPLLVKFQLPAETSHDMLLCGLYYRTFIAHRPDVATRRAAGARTGPGHATDDTVLMAEPVNAP
jgi:uncharacterized RDD family membrane protein YckC